MQAAAFGYPAMGAGARVLRGPFGMQFLLDFVLKTRVFAAYKG